jgi:hypothetical protein
MSSGRSRTFAAVVLAVLVPVAAAAVLCTGPALKSFDAESSAGEVQRLAGAADRTYALVHQLQGEQLLAVRWMGGATEVGPLWKEQQARTDRAVKRFRAVQGDLRKWASAETRDKMADLDETFGELGTFRQDILEHRLSLDAATFRFAAASSYLLDIVESAKSITDDPTLRARTRSLAGFARAKWAASVEAAMISAMLAAPKPAFEPGQFRDVIATLTDQEHGLRDFQDDASRVQQRAVEKALSGPAFDKAREMEDAIVRAEDGPLPINRDAWASASTEKLAAMYAVEKGLTADLARTAADRRAAASREAWTYVGVGAGIVLLAVLGLFLALRRNRNRPTSPAAVGDPPALPPAQAA